MIGPTYERLGRIETHYAIEGTRIRINSDLWIPAHNSADGNGVVLELSNYDFGVCIFSDIDPDATGLSNLQDQSIGMTLHAIGEDNTAQDMITDVVCRMWIFD